MGLSPSPSGETGKEGDAGKFPPDIPFSSKYKDCSECLSCPGTFEEPPSEILSTVDMETELTSTMKAYHEQVLLCAPRGTAPAWAPKLDEVPRHLVAELQSLLKKRELPSGARGRPRCVVSACDGAVCFSEETAVNEDKGTDAMLLPDGGTDAQFCPFELIHFPSFTSFLIRSKEHLKKVVDVLSPLSVLDLGSLDESIVHRSVSSRVFALVCVHTQRDGRCGAIGPQIIQEMERVLMEKWAKGSSCADSVVVRGISHVGGHAYAGNLILYRQKEKESAADGKSEEVSSSVRPVTEGHWYARVHAGHVPALVEEHIEGGKVLKCFWRGRITPECW